MPMKYVVSVDITEKLSFYCINFAFQYGNPSFSSELPSFKLKKNKFFKRSYWISDQNTKLLKVSFLKTLHKWLS